MRPVQCAPRGSSYAISHESQSCVLSAGSSGSVACCVLGRLWTVSCVVIVMSTEVTERRTRNGNGDSVTRLRDGTVESRDKTIRCTTCVFVYSNIVVLHQILSCTICRLHVRRPTPQMKATRMPPGVGGSVFFVRFETFVCRVSERSYMYKDSRSTRNYMR
jgi:hypothetical protein